MVKRKSKFKSDLKLVGDWQAVSLEGCRRVPGAAGATCSGVSWALRPACCCCLPVSSLCSEGRSRTHQPHRSSCPEGGVKRETVSLNGSHSSQWWNKIKADKSWLPSCQVWRGCQMCADVLAARGLRLGGVEGQLWGSPGSYPSGLLARCGAGLHRRQGGFMNKRWQQKGILWHDLWTAYQ